MNNFRNLSDIEKFFKDLTHYKSFMTGGLVEVVVDLTHSKYFNPESQLDDLIKFAFKEADDGHQVFFGPANRKEDLGSSRSKGENIFCFKSLWVDIDSPDKPFPPDQRLDAAKKLLQEFLARLKRYGLEPTYVIESGHGYHVYFILDKFYQHPSEKWPKMQSALIIMAKGDLQAKDPVRLMRVPGTYNCKDPDNPKQVKILHASDKKYSEEDFGQLVIDYSPKVSSKKVTTPSGATKLGFIPPCIESLLDPQNKPLLGHRHQVRQVISTYGFHEGWTVEDTIQKVMHTTDDPNKAERDVRGVYQVLERDPDKYSVGCGEGSQLRALVDANIAICDEGNCQFKQPKETETPKKEEFSIWFDGLVDLIQNDEGKPAFLVIENGSPIIKGSHETDEVIFIPPPVNKIRWLIPRASEVLKYYASDTDARLFEDLVNYHKSISELPSEHYYKYLAVWDMHTYLMENFEYSPINWFYAIPERGKSRTGKSILYVAWRGMIMVTFREQHIIRFATDYQATLFMDVMDLWKRVERSGSEDIILSRYERGITVPKVLYPDKGKFEDTEFYELFGPTVVATNMPVHHILETRAVQIVMPESERFFENDVKPEDGLPFRERLVAFRARWLLKKLPDVDKPIKGRLGDILRPIRRIVQVVCSDESWFLEFVAELEESRKKDGMDSDEALVLNAIIQSLAKVENGHLLHSDILSKINQQREERYKMSPQKLGRITRSLGFNKYNSGEARGIYIDADLLNRLCQRYGIKQSDGILTI